MSMKLNIEAVSWIEQANSIVNNGRLTVIGLNDLGHNIERIFTITDVPVNVMRGQHSHKQLNQFFMCIKGKVQINFNDGKNDKSFTLDKTSHVLHGPPSIWCEQKYLTDDAVLMVCCDRPYDEDDYIRDYDDYLAWRGS